MGLNNKLFFPAIRMSCIMTIAAQRKQTPYFACENKHIIFSCSTLAA